MAKEFSATLDLLDFRTTDLALVAGTWNRIGVYTVLAGMRIAVGRRYDGYVYLIMKNTTGGVQFHGKIRFQVADPTESIKKTVLEFNSRESSDPADKTKKVFVPLKMPWIGQDSKLIMEIDPEANNTIDVATAGQSILILDITKKVMKA